MARKRRPSSKPAKKKPAAVTKKRKLAPKRKPAPASKKTIRKPARKPVKQARKPTRKPRKPALTVKAAKRRAWARKPSKGAKKLAQAWKPIPRTVSAPPAPKKRKKPKSKKKAPRTFAEALAKLTRLEAQALRNAYELAFLRREEWRRTVYRSVIEIKGTYGKDEDEAFYPSMFDVQWVRDLTGLTARQVYTLFVSPDIGIKGTGLATYSPHTIHTAAA